MEDTSRCPHSHNVAASHLRTPQAWRTVSSVSRRSALNYWKHSLENRNSGEFCRELEDSQWMEGTSWQRGHIQWVYRGIEEIIIYNEASIQSTIWMQILRSQRGQQRRWNLQIFVSRRSCSPMNCLQIHLCIKYQFWRGLLHRLRPSVQYYQTVRSGF
jgi:hypothetical protein